MEAICAYRRQLDGVVMVYCPAHRGVSANAYADAAAKSYLQAEAQPLSLDVAKMVQSRPCVYERRVRKEEGVLLELADRTIYKEGRMRARAFVRGRLGAGVRPGRTTAEVTGKLWSEVVAATGKAGKYTEQDDRQDAVQRHNESARR